MKLKDIVSVLEDFAPLSLQESYDNSGIQYGEEERDINKILVCLDLTEQVIDEAILNSCELIVSHHPVLFKPVKSFTESSLSSRIMIKAIQNYISLYTSHTNLDNVSGGVSFVLAQKLGLNAISVLKPLEGSLRKLIVFSPVDFTEKVVAALNMAGAGQIGNYKDCSFRSRGTGSFTPSENSNPALGTIGRREEVAEDKVEVIFPVYLQNRVVKEMLKVHPYEEVAYEITELKNSNQSSGAGAIGTLDAQMDAQEFLSYLKEKLDLDTIRYTSFQGKIQKVAVCGGSGSFLLDKAVSEKATAFVSADFKYHDYFNADNKILVADIGHYESEVYTKELFYAALTKKIPNIAVLFSTINTNPVKYYH